jgi:succinyl-diaminopimelate desuccinylase
VAIGTGWEGDGPAHETDERMAISSLNKMAQIYGHLMVRLAQEAEKLA